jgi:hypothetical protein
METEQRWTLPNPCREYRKRVYSLQQHCDLVDVSQRCWILMAWRHERILSAGYFCLSVLSCQLWSALRRKCYLYRQGRELQLSLICRIVVLKLKLRHILRPYSVCLLFCVYDWQNSRHPRTRATRSCLDPYCVVMFQIVHRYKLVYHYY